MARDAAALDGEEVPKLPAAEILYRFQALLSNHPEIPQDSKNALDSWLHQLLQRAQADPGEKTNGQAPVAQKVLTGRPSEAPPQDKPARAQAAVEIRTPEALRLQAALQAHEGSPQELPQTWEAWIRGTAKALSDPGVSPKEAPFHSLQAREQTGFFEIPLPWMGQAPLQMWVEADPPEGRKDGEGGSQRILLGLHFSRLGETRIGLERNATKLNVRIWAEHPEVLASEEESLAKELDGIGRRVNLQIIRLGPGSDGTIPSLRSVVAGPSLHAMG